MAVGGKAKPPDLDHRASHAVQGRQIIDLPAVALVQRGPVCQCQAAETGDQRAGCHLFYQHMLA